eukprot:s3900_g4.t2
MDDLLHGLSLLGPRIEQMSAQLEKVSQEVAEHRNLLTLKAEQADIGQMRSQLGSLGHGLAQKVDQLDRETSEFMTTAMQKITRIGEQLENKAASGRLDQLEERLSKVLQGIERKAEDMALRRLEEQVIVLGEGVEGKAERNELQKAQEKLQELANAMDPKAEKSDLEPLRKRLEESALCRPLFERLSGIELAAAGAGGIGLTPPAAEAVASALSGQQSRELANLGSQICRGHNFFGDAFFAFALEKLSSGTAIASSTGAALFEQAAREKKLRKYLAMSSEEERTEWWEEGPGAHGNQAQRDNLPPITGRGNKKAKGQLQAAAQKMPAQQYNCLCHTLTHAGRLAAYGPRAEKACAQVAHAQSAGSQTVRNKQSITEEEDSKDHPKEAP